MSDYAPGHYTGALTPSPPHADMNAKKAVVVFWKDHPQRFVFSHEASYCPYLELPNGAGMCNQFFEGNLGEAELMNNMGRKEKNSFVDVIQSGPQRVWVRWTYFAVNMKDDTQPRLARHGGLFRLSQRAGPAADDLRESHAERGRRLQHATPSNCSAWRRPVRPIKDLFPRDAEHGDYLTHTVLDLYGNKRYDIYWDEKGKVRRRGDDATLAAITRSPGCALVLPFREKLLFAVLGEASGFPREKNQLVDHCTPGAEGGCGWGAGLWDHWPIGWLNSQSSIWKPGSPYAYSFGSVGQFFVPEGKRIKSFWKDYSEYCKDMEFNRWTARRVSYVLLGAARGWDDIRRIGRSWLDKGKQCAKPESIADLK